MSWTISEAILMSYVSHLRGEERSAGTISKYMRDTRDFAAWLENRALNREEVAGWKNALQEKGLQPVTVNPKLAALNGLLRFLGREDCRARYLTVEAARAGQAEIALKGKIRTILIPAKLCRRLLKYAAKNKIASGELFLTRSGKSMSRGQIWAEMKGLCAEAGIAATKVFPHNLRHLFATAFYRVSKDIARLADVLGHSSIETTRIYLLTTGAEYSKQLERLRLIC